MGTEHIVKSYDQELQNLSDQLMEMASKEQIMLADMIRAVTTLDYGLAKEIEARDPEIDRKEREIDALAVRILALRHPVAQDLRMVVAALKISGDLERIGDYITNISRRVEKIAEPLPQDEVEILEELVHLTQEMIFGVMEAYKNQDMHLAERIWQADQKVDDLYTTFLNDLLRGMAENPDRISIATHIVFIAKNIERIGDHVTNIAEMIYYQVSGLPFNAESAFST